MPITLEPNNLHLKAGTIIADLLAGAISVFRCTILIILAT